MPPDGDVLELKIEPSGEVREAKSGNRVGTLIDENESDRALSAYACDLIDAAHARFRWRGRDPKDPKTTRLLRDAYGEIEKPFLLAGNAGDLGVRDVVVPGTQATYMADPMEMLADIVCPVTLVRKSSGAWLAENLTIDVPADFDGQGGSAGGSPFELNPQLTSTIYDSTGGQGFSVQYPFELFSNTDINLEKLAVRRLCNNFKIRREKRVANLLTTSANFAVANRTAAAAKWDQASGQTPIVDIFTAMTASLKTPTHLIVSESLQGYYLATASVQQFYNALFSSQDGRQQFPKLLIGTMRATIAGSVSYVWGASTSANVPLVYAPEDSPEAILTARTLRYIGDAPDATSARECGGMMLRRYFEARRGPHGSQQYVLVTNDTDVVLNNQLGCIITGAGA